VSLNRVAAPNPPDRNCTSNLGAIGFAPQIWVLGPEKGKGREGMGREKGREGKGFPL